MWHLLYNFLIDTIKHLYENDDQKQIVNNCLEIKHVGISWESVKPCVPHEQSIYQAENHHECDDEMALDVFSCKSEIAANQAKLHDLNVLQKRVLVQYYLYKSEQEQSIALESEDSPLIFGFVMLRAHGHDRVASPDDLPHLEHYHESKDKVGSNEEADVLFEDFDRDVEVDSDVYAVILNGQNVDKVVLLLFYVPIEVHQ